MKMTLTNFRYNGKHKEQKSWQEISYPLGEDVHAVTWARRLQNHRDGFHHVPMNIDDLECCGSVDAYVRTCTACRQGRRCTYYIERILQLSVCKWTCTSTLLLYYMYVRTCTACRQGRDACMDSSLLCS
jgi:hypothetical protein